MYSSTAFLKSTSFWYGVLSGNCKKIWNCAWGLSNKNSIPKWLSVMAIARLRFLGNFGRTFSPNWWFGCLQEIRCSSSLAHSLAGKPKLSQTTSRFRHSKGEPREANHRFQCFLPGSDLQYHTAGEQEWLSIKNNMRMNSVGSKAKNAMNTYTRCLRNISLRRFQSWKRMPKWHCLDSKTMREDRCFAEQEC